MNDMYSPVYSFTITDFIDFTIMGALIVLLLLLTSKGGDS